MVWGSESSWGSLFIAWLLQRAQFVVRNTESDPPFPAHAHDISKQAVLSMCDRAKCVHQHSPAGLVDLTPSRQSYRVHFRHQSRGAMWSKEFSSSWSQTQSGLGAGDNLHGCKRYDRIMYAKHCELQNVMLEEATWSYQGLHTFSTTNSAEGGWKEPPPTGQSFAHKRLPKSLCGLLQENRCPLVSGSERWEIRRVLCGGHWHIGLWVVLPANRLVNLRHLLTCWLPANLKCLPPCFTETIASGLEWTPASSHIAFWPSSDPS